MIHYILHDPLWLTLLAVYAVLAAVAVCEVAGAKPWRCDP